MSLSVLLTCVCFQVEGMAESRPEIVLSSSPWPLPPTSKSWSPVWMAGRSGQWNERRGLGGEVFWWDRVGGMDWFVAQDM